MAIKGLKSHVKSLMICQTDPLIWAITCTDKGKSFLPPILSNVDMGLAREIQKKKSSQNLQFNYIHNKH